MSQIIYVSVGYFMDFRFYSEYDIKIQEILKRRKTGLELRVKESF